jgi:hypothetical protein
VDPELVRELEEQLRQLTAVVSHNTAALGGFNAIVTNGNRAINNNIQSSDKLTQAINQNNQSFQANNNSNNPLNRAIKDAAADHDQLRLGLKQATDSGVQGLLSLKNAVLGTEQGFSKYNTTIGKVGDVAWDVGKNFGVLGKILGGLVKVASDVLQYQTQQADNLLTASDNLSKMGAGGAFATEQIRKFGAGAGLTSAELDKLIKPMQAVQGGFVTLGGSQAAGMKAFAEMTAVSEDVRREFRRLGMDDQDRNQSMADFVSLMNASGQTRVGELKTSEGLQKASLEYTRQMYVLADMTGKDVETAKKQHQAAMAGRDVQLMTFKLNQDSLAAEKKKQAALQRGDMEAASAAQRDMDAADKKIKTITVMRTAMEKAGFTTDQFHQALNQKLIGATTEETSGLARRGIFGGQIFDRLYDGTMSEAEMSELLMKNTIDTTNRVGVGNLAAMKGLGEKQGLYTENIAAANQRLSKNYIENAADVAKRIAENALGKGVAAEDPAQQLRNDMIETQRAIKLKLDDMAASMNPLLGNMGMLKGLGYAALAAAGALGISAAMEGLGSIKNLLGKGAGAGGAGAGAGAGGAGAGAGAGGAGGGAKAAATEAEALAKGGAKATGEGLLKSGLKSALNPKNLLKLGTGLLKGIPSLLGGMVLDYRAEKARESGENKKAAVYDIANAALTGAGIGATLGSIVPGVGTAIGAGVGAAIGGIIGVWSNWKDISGDDGKEKQGEKREDSKPTDDTILTKLLDQISIVQKYKFDVETVTKNAQAMASFTTAMSSVFTVAPKGDEKEKARAVADSVSSFMAVKVPVKDFVYFSSLKIDKSQAEVNSNAFVAFSTAMSSYKGTAGNALTQITDTISSSIVSMFTTKLPFDDFVNFANLPLDPEKAQKSSMAFVNFANSMASYKAGPGLSDAVGQLAGKAFNTIFGQKGPVDMFVEFTKKDFGPNAKDNAEAFYNYAQSIGLIVEGKGKKPSESGGAGSSAPAPSTPSAPSAPAGGAATPRPTGPAMGSAAVGGLTSLQTKSGKSFKVGQAFSRNFQGFVDELESLGYKIDSVGGYADRANANNPGVKSYHALGAAIDINPNRNPNRSTRTDLPPQTGALAAKYGLGWGMNWRSVKDPMHFSAARSELGSFNISRGSLRGYASGVDFVPESGPAIVGELGSELITGKDGSTRLTDSGSHIENLNKGDSVLPADKTKEVLPDASKMGVVPGTKYPTRAPVGTMYDSFINEKGEKINKYVDEDLTTRFVPESEGEWKPQKFPTHAPVGTKYGSFVDKDGKKWDKFVGDNLTSVFKPAKHYADGTRLSNSKDKAVKTVKTKGGDYNVYKKNSDTAASFRDMYAKALKSGAGTFKWIDASGKENLYSTGKKGGLYAEGPVQGPPMPFMNGSSQTEAGNSNILEGKTAAPVAPLESGQAGIKLADEIANRDRAIKDMVQQGIDPAQQVAMAGESARSLGNVVAANATNAESQISKNDTAAVAAMPQEQQIQIKEQAITRQADIDKARAEELAKNSKPRQGFSLMHPSTWWKSYAEGTDLQNSMSMPSSEKVGSVDHNSILTQLAKTPSETVNQSVSENNNNTSTSQEQSQDDNDQSMEMFMMIHRKLDNMVSVLENSNKTHKKLLDNAR